MMEGFRWFDSVHKSIHKRQGFARSSAMTCLGLCRAVQQDHYHRNNEVRIKEKNKARENDFVMLFRSSVARLLAHERRPLQSKQDEWSKNKPEEQEEERQREEIASFALSLALSNDFWMMWWWLHHLITRKVTAFKSNRRRGAKGLTNGSRRFVSWSPDYCNAHGILFSVVAAINRWNPPGSARTSYTQDASTTLH